MPANRLGETGKVPWMNRVRTGWLLALAVVATLYGSSYLFMRLTHVIVHVWGWKFDPIGAREPWAPAIHFVEVMQDAYPSPRVKVARRIIGFMYMPIMTMEKGVWRLKDPRVMADDEAYLKRRMLR